MHSRGGGVTLSPNQATPPSAASAPQPRTPQEDDATIDIAAMLEQLLTGGASPSQESPAARSPLFAKTKRGLPASVWVGD